MRLLVLRFLFVVFWLLVCTAYAQPPVIGYNLLELPSSRRAIQALSQPMGLTISQTPIRDVLNSVSQSQSISIFLDRRIDPSLPVSIQASSRDSVLIDVLNRIGENAGAEISLIENVVYVGPRGKTQALQRTAVALHHSISFAQVRKGGPATTELHALEWDELSTPADIEAEIAKTWSIQSSLNLPHDLFHAWSIHQPCSLATQLAILCGGFGREPEFGAEGKFTSRDIQDIASWRTKYPVRDTRIAPRCKEP